jgi:hypothetical protein
MMQWPISALVQAGGESEVRGPGDNQADTLRRHAAPLPRLAGGTGKVHPGMPEWPVGSCKAVPPRRIEHQTTSEGNLQ